MFTARNIKELMTAIPFRPFRIHMSDGSSYEVVNRDMALVGQNSVEVGADPDANGIAGRFVRCAIIHISRIEELQTA